MKAGLAQPSSESRKYSDPEATIDLAVFEKSEKEYIFNDNP